MGIGPEDSVVTEAELRELYATRLVRRPAGRSDCPDPVLLQALARREGPEEPRLGTLDHVMRCADCRAEFDLLRSIEVAGRDPASAGRPSRRNWLVSAGIAAALLVAVGLGRSTLGTNGEDDVVRGAPGAGAVRLLTPAAEAKAGNPLIFSWRPVAGATRYRLEVLDSACEVAFQTETVDTLVVAGQARLAPGEYQWWIGTMGSPTPRRSELRPLRLTR